MGPPTQVGKTWTKWLEEHSLADLIELPRRVADQAWSPTPADREAAWDLYTEIRTRISTHPLHYRSGDEETALQSIYELFVYTRNALHKYKPACRHFAILSVFVLNRDIRPFTAKWHKKLVDNRFRHDDERRKFREELQALQEKLRPFMRLLGHLAEDSAFIPGSESGLLERTDKKSVPLEKAMPFDILLVGDQNGMKYQEQEALRHRRAKARENHTAIRTDCTDIVGLALSGGGIRSATFALGVVQRMAQAGLLPFIDYLSTVSGGGYFGAFLSSFLGTPAPHSTASNQLFVPHANVGLGKDQLPFFQSGKTESDAIRHLRNNSKYLLQGGFLGRARMLGLMLYGILANIVILLLPILVLVLITNLFAIPEHAWTTVQSVVSTALFGVLALALLILPIMHRADGQKFLKQSEKFCLYLFVICLGWMLWLGTTNLMAQLLTHTSPYGVLFVAASLPFLCAILSFIAGLTRPLGKFLMALVGITGPVFILLAYGVFNVIVDFHQPIQLWAWLGGWTLPWYVVLLVGIYLSLVLNINLISPHRYYRNRLAETYLIRHSDGQPEGVDPQPLSTLPGGATGSAAPYHLINAALNIPASTRSDLRGRHTDFFLFSKHYCGSPIVGYHATSKVEKLDPHLDLGTAMAISGAAAAPYMGTQTLKSVSFWMAVLNIRLGYWVPNPCKIQQQRWLGGPGAWYFLRELFGRLHEKTRYWNVSDGGHIENLGIYELLRRQCKFIIAIDGEADPDMTFGGLIQVIRFAKIDFGIDLDIDLEDLRKGPSGYSKAHFALGKIRYNVQGNTQTGFLLYVKLSMTGNELEYIRDYQARNPSFPHQTTADQFFDEDQFEAYRALGHHAGDDLFRAELVGKSKADLDLNVWFEKLAANLFEDTGKGTVAPTHTP